MDEPAPSGDEGGRGLPEARRSLLAALVIGVGLMAAVDEIVFHQLLHWHHFWDRSTPAAGLVSDGLLHGAELVAFAAGIPLWADLRRRGVLARRHALAGLLLGLGGFQLFDGLVDHKLLDAHEVRYGVDLLPYDLAWNGAALALLVAGLAVLGLARRPAGRAA